MKFLKKAAMCAVVISMLISTPLYAAADNTSPPLTSANKITVTNNFDMNDTMVIGGLTEDDVINVYADAQLTAPPIGTAIADASGVATVSVAQFIANDAAGVVYVTVTNSGSTESPAIPVAVPPVKVSSPLGISNITVTNNADTDDIITVGGLARGDVINVYSDKSMTPTTLLGTATAAPDGTVRIFAGQISVIDVYVTLTHAGGPEGAPYTIALPDVGTTAVLQISNSVTVSNNVGSNDTIVVTGLAAGDILNVYSDDTLTSLLGTATVGPGGTTATLTVDLSGCVSGFVYLTVTSIGARESSAYPVAVPADGVSAPLSVNNPVIVTNNPVGTNDSVVVSNLTQGDIIKVYSDKSLTSLLGTATASATGVATVSAAQLTANDTAGIIYITLTSSGESESTAVPVAVPAKGVSVPLTVNNPVIVTNNSAGTNDTVVVSNLLQGDIIKVYTDDSLTSLLGTGTASTAGVATVTVAQLTANDKAGIVYVTVTSLGLLESTAVPVSVPDLAGSTSLSLANIKSVINNALGTNDTIVISGLASGDKIKFYTDSSLTSLIGTATANASGTATFSTPQLIAGDAAGTVYVTVTSTGKPESTGFPVSIPAAGTTAPLTDPSAITITNNAAGKSDTIVVTGLTQGDKIKVYSDNTLVNMIGSAAASAAGTATVTIAQIDDAGGTVYITVTSPGLKESTAISETVNPAGQSKALNDSSDITVTNNAGANDTIVINGLLSGDKVKVYSDITKTNLLGTAVASSAGKATVTVAQLFADENADSNVYVTVTSIGLLESDPYTIAVVAAGQSDPLDTSNIITITNNAAGTNDTVSVTNLKQGDKIKVYADDNLVTLIGTATAAATGIATLSVPQITANDATGTVYITVTRADKTESDWVQADVDKTPNSTSPLSSANTITVKNNSLGKNDTIVITRLAQGDKIRVYADSALTILIATATAAAAGQVTISVPQLTADDVNGGPIYITVTNVAATESTAVTVTVPPVNMSPALSGFNTVKVTENIAGTNDVIVVDGLSQNDKIKVYADSTLMSLIGSAVANASGIATFKTPQLVGNDIAGDVYITVTTPGLLESGAADVKVPAAQISPALSDQINLFTPTNNAAGTNDTIEITRLTQGDTIKVYADINCSVLLGSAKVPASGTVVVSIPQLIPKDGSGNVYITVTNAGKIESPAANAYILFVPAAPKSLQLSKSSPVAITNNAAGTNDTVVVGGLSQNDRIKVYADAQMLKLLGTATAAANGTATATIAQIANKDNAGTVYITVTTPAMLESDPQDFSFMAATQTSPLSKFSTVTIVNNVAGTNDTIVITLLAKGDKVKVYSDVDCTKLLGTGTADAMGTAKLSIPQLTPNDAAGSVYITVTNIAALESIATEEDFTAAPKTAAIPSVSNITVTNNAAGISDKVVVTNLARGDKIKVYADAALTALLGSAAATAAGVATVTVPQITPKDAAGNIYVTVTNLGARESDAIQKDVQAANGTNALPLSNIKATNYAGTNDTVVVTKLAKGDKVKVYADSNCKALLGTATAATDTATVTVPQLIANDAAGTIYITVTNVGSTESPAVPFDVAAALPTADLAAGITNGTNTVVPKNNAFGTSDTVVVTGLIQGDKVKVYADSKLTNLLGTGIAAANNTATVTVSQLVAKDAAGTVYVTVTTPGKLPCSAVAVSVPPAFSSSALDPSKITITNNAAGRNDTIVVTGLNPGDKIKVYADSKLTHLLGTGIAGAKGTATLSISQLTPKDAAGTVYMTLTTPKCTESPPIAEHVDAADVTRPIS